MVISNIYDRRRDSGRSLGGPHAGDAASSPARPTAPFWQRTGPDEISFAEGRPDLEIGPSSVTVEPDGSYRLVARIPSETGGSPLSLNLTVSARSRRYLPPVDISGEGMVSGYTVPLLDARATGLLCEGSLCQPIEGARTYHDHNWGTWSGVTWDWGQALVGDYSVLYGGVSSHRGLNADEEALAGDDLAGDDQAGNAAGPRILYLADENGYAGIFPIRRLTTRWPNGDRQTAPESISILATSGTDSLELTVTVGHTRATPVPVRVGSPSALFFQMRGRAALAGRLRGSAVNATGDGFFETWTR